MRCSRRIPYGAGRWRRLPATACGPMSCGTSNGYRAKARWIRHLFRSACLTVRGGRATKTGHRFALPLPEPSPRSARTICGLLRRSTCQAMFQAAAAPTSGALEAPACKASSSPCGCKCSCSAASGQRRTGGGQHRKAHRTPQGESASDRHARHPACRSPLLTGAWILSALCPYLCQRRGVSLPEG